MTIEATETAEAAIHPFSGFQDSVTLEGAQPVKRQSRGKPDSAATAAARRTSSLDCSHHWVIEVAIHPLSKGVCKSCGEERLFRNWIRWSEIMPTKVVDVRSQTGERSNQTGEDEVNSMVTRRRYGEYFGARAADAGNRQAL